MARWQGTTAERGYGHEHKKERARRLALYRPGQPCAHGGEPMNYPLPVLVRDAYGARLVSPWLHLPHTADRSGYLPGLSCARHNLADGARRKNRKQARPGVAGARRTRAEAAEARSAKAMAKAKAAIAMSLSVTAAPGTPRTRNGVRHP